MVDWQECTGFYTLFLAATEILNFKMYMQMQKKKKIIANVIPCHTLMACLFYKSLYNNLGNNEKKNRVRATKLILKYMIEMMIK